MSIQEHIQYLRKLRPYVGVSIALLAAGLLFGIAAISYAPGAAQHLNEGVTGFVRLFRELPKPQLAAAIFFNNTIKTLVVILGGVLLGIVPVVFLLVNGAAVGLVLFVSVQHRGVLRSLLAILPHGVLEIPAVLLGTSIGLMLGSCAINTLSGTAEATMRRELVRAMKFFIAVVVPLLAIAAVVESFLTSALVEM